VRQAANLQHQPPALLAPKTTSQRKRPWATSSSAPPCAAMRRFLLEGGRLRPPTASGRQAGRGFAADLPPGSPRTASPTGRQMQSHAAMEGGRPRPPAAGRGRSGPSALQGFDQRLVPEMEGGRPRPPAAGLGRRLFGLRQSSGALDGTRPAQSGRRLPQSKALRAVRRQGNCGLFRSVPYRLLTASCRLNGPDRSGVERPQFLAGAEIVAAETVPHRRAEHLFRRHIVQVHGNPQHRVQRDQVRADPPE